jgi:lysine-N-methylase
MEPTEAGPLNNAEFPAGLLPIDRIAGGLPAFPAIAPPRQPSFPPVDLPDLPGRPAPERRQYARPAYAARFQCIASACEDTCCKGWGVPIDQGTYEKYRSNPALKPFVGTLIVLNTNGPTTADYARMPLTVNGTCGFLQTDSLCGIHRHFGPEMLSVTCSTYPRAAVTTAGIAEEALNLSCPEAARIALLDPFLLGDGPWRAPGPERFAGVWRDAAKPLHRDEVRLAIREYALLLVSDRGYPLWQRLYLLGSLVRRLKAQSGASPLADWCDANPAAVAHALADGARIAASGRLRASMAEIAVDPAEQLQLVIELVRMRVSAPPVSGRFLECVKDFEAGLGCATATHESQIVEAYRRGYRDFYKPLMERLPHLMENCLINHIFKNGYPFGRASGKAVALAAAATPADAEDEHLAMCVNAALAQTLLIGMAAHYRERFDETHVVKLVESLARSVEHSTSAIDQMKQFVEARGLKNLRGIAVLLRHQD